MSMCPNADLYSAWLDNEVPSPWKEKLEQHLNSCPECASRVSKFKSISARLTQNQPAPLGTERLEASFERLMQKRAVLLFRKSEPAGSSFSNWFSTSVRLPVPVLAAALFAAVFIPSFFAVRAQQNAANIPSLYSQAVQPYATIVSGSPIYSPDLPYSAISRQITTQDDRQIFRLVQIAEQFAANEKVFQDSDIIIIKLPTPKGFDGSDTSLITGFDSLNTLSESQR